MTSVMRQLARKRLDERLAPMRPIASSIFRAPRGGWIRAVREALGMPRRELGRRMGVGEKRVMQLERGEVEGKLTLHTLARAAAALDCDLVVVLVPKRPLQQTVMELRKQKAAAWIESRVLHTMMLAGQAVSLEDLPPQLIEEVERGYSDRRLWE